ncbi:hypothetical protein B0T25DRAFT_559921 [Lasiosphaeria hispida]|uniref:Uncharacterized protein n=1 Tax=Lasiosphaeria hispida TaxID=260671 RepID=A0AAJ0H7I1_9PEZI|nr:hypothetical protein B0T25DRAFT_559921 [Lasiosphaeria hispida]
MPAYNFKLAKDELSLPAWLAIGAAAQALVSWTAPAAYALVPVAVVSSILLANLALQCLGWVRSTYLRDAVLDRTTVLFPEDDGSRPETLGTKPVAIFWLGIRSNHPVGRLHPLYQKLNKYLDDMYAECEANRATNGFLGRSPDLVASDYSQNNTLHSVSYWKSIEHLEAFSRRPVHIKGFKFLVSTIMGGSQDLGVLHEVLYCPAGHWEAIYTNVKSQNFGSLKWPMAKSGNLRGPYIERDPDVIKGMWGRMGNKLKQDESDEKFNAAMAAS